MKSIDMNSWPRSSHWNYYRNIVKAAVSMTHKIDVSALLDFCHREGKNFSPVFLHTISKTVNSLDCMKMFADEKGNPMIWDVVHPNFTIFHPDDETFSDVWIEYYPELDQFIENYNQVLQEYGNKKGIKVRDNQPANFFPVSCIPWIAYENFSSYTSGNSLPMLFPVLDYGKYERVGEKVLLPFSITISHAAMDGYHLAKFFETLQSNIDQFQ